MTEGDPELLARATAGDQGAREALFSRHYLSVLRFFELNATWVADDLTQRTFVACLEKLSSVPADGFRPYLFGIARNLLLRHHRKQGRHDRAVRIAQEDSTAKTSLSVVAMRREDEVLLLMAISTLPIDLQIAVELYYWESMSTAAVGEVVQANASTVGSRLARARELIVQAVVDMTRPGALRDRIVLNLDHLHRSLGPPTLAANAQRPTP